MCILKMDRQIDILKLASFAGINLPSRWVIYLALLLVVLVPLLAIYQAIQLKKYGGSHVWFWAAIALSVIVLLIYLYSWFKSNQILHKFSLRKDEDVLVSV